MDPRRFQDLARFLDGPPAGVPQEAAWRSACGRAYYAAFGYASELLRQAGLDVPDDDEAHRDVAAHLKSSGDPRVRTAGGDLERLRRNRNSADYDVGSIPPRKFPFDADTSEWAVERAGKVIAVLQTKKGEDPTLEITAK